MSKEIEQHLNRMVGEEDAPEKLTRNELFLRYINTPEKQRAVEMEVFGEITNNLAHTTDSDLRQAVQALVARGELQEQEERDFRSPRMKSVDGALRDLQSHVEELLGEVEEQREAGNWDLEPESLDGYDYHATMIRNMSQRLQ